MHALLYSGLLSRLLTHTSARNSGTLTGKSEDIAPFSWLLVHTRFMCALKESVSPVLWKFYNQIPLASKVKFPGGSQFLCRISTLGNLWWTIELSEQCKSFFAIIVLQFVGCLLDGSTVWLMVTSSKKTYTTHHTSQSAAARTPVLRLFTSN